MRVAAGFDHANDQLGNVRNDHDGTEILYAPGDPEYHEVIDRPTALSPSARGSALDPG